MKIILRKLKLRQEEAAYFTYNGPLEDDFLPEGTAAIDGPVSINIVIKRQDKAYYGQGSLETAILYTCSRCLTKFVQPLVLDLAMVFQEKDDETEYAEEVIPLINDEADIKPYIEGVIFAELPLSPVCRTDCQGLCPACGNDKNTGSCVCRVDDIDPRWEKLKKYK